MTGDVLRTRAGRATPRAGSRLGHSATIAIASAVLVGCGMRGPPSPTPTPTQGGYVLVFRADLADIIKLCDGGRAIYFAEGAYKAAMAVVEDAPECDGNAYVVDEAETPKGASS